ncbi:unnamed protein product [Peniophora sp. CBMAI 1063]|nr:unnamed protein product [Peniophora sp. CBMAI 1063]
MALFPSSQAFTMLFYPSAPRTHSVVSTARSAARAVSDPKDGPIKQLLNSTSFSRVDVRAQSSDNTPRLRKPTRKGSLASLRERFTPMMVKLRERTYIPNAI